MAILNATDRETFQLLYRAFNGDMTALEKLFGDGMDSTGTRTDLTDLVARDSVNFPNGSTCFVIAENETYQLDTANSFTAFSPLIIGRTVASGRWFRRSKAYVVGNFTMWVSPFSGPTAGFGPHLLYGYTPGQLLASSNAPGDIVLDLSAALPATNSMFDVLVDNLNNVWVASFASGHSVAAGQSIKLALSSILQSGAPTPAVRLSAVPGTSITEVWASAGFDKTNALWIAQPSHGTFGVATFLKYGAPSYALTGAPTPDISITLQATPASPDSGFFTFDSAGNLWLSVGVTIAGVTGLRMISAAQLGASSAALVPAVNWSGALWNTQNPQGIAFGPTGDLWVADFNNNTLKSYDARAAASGNQAPLLTITSASLNGPDGIAFDASGNLWVTNDNDGRSMRFAAADLTTSGAKVPPVIISPPNITFGNMVAFANNPQRSGLLPSGLPL